MFDDEPATLAGAIVAVLALPFQVPVRMWRSRREAVRQGGEARSIAVVLLISLAFVPIVVLYEAFAVPLVAGSTVIALLLIVPAGLIGACWEVAGAGLRRVRAPMATDQVAAARPAVGAVASTVPRR